jgi:hypothetical protein
VSPMRQHGLGGPRSTLAALASPDRRFQGRGHGHDALDAVYEENRFQRDSEKLGAEGAPLWARFDKEMDRLHETQFPKDAGPAD